MKRSLKNLVAAAGLLAVLLFGLGLTACKGPERAPRQPITGVDTPPEEAQTRPSR